MLNTQNEDKNTVFYSYLACFSSCPLSAESLSREALSWRRQFVGSLAFTLPVSFVIYSSL